MARAATQFMERDITSAFGSVDRDEVKTLVGTRDWLTFVGITENPPTLRQISPDVQFEVPHSDMSRITYRLIRDPEVADQFLLIRLVQLDVDDIAPVAINVVDVTERTVDAWNAIILDANPDTEPNVVPTDFELASNILDMEFRYGMLKTGVALTDIWTEWELVFEDGGLPEVERRAWLGELWEETIDWYESWDSRGRPDRKLPDVIEVRLAVRADAQMPTQDTMRRVFRSRIFLPLGYRRTMPLALQ
jgi:hypothetical protein